ncbi:flavoprotein-like protein [Pavlovales sp. CCMP2436]|nr:flavoprotein-like protein [Pavlovales sp. CCMP2436]
MAALVAQGARKIPGMVVRLRSCDEAVAEDVIWADGIACGTPTNLGGIAWRMKKWWDDFAAENWGKCDGKLCTVFSSQGGHGGGAEITCQAMSTVMMNFGFLSFGVSDYVSKIHTLHYGCVVAKRPRNDHDKAACDRLGLRLAEWVAYFVDGRKSLHPLLTTKADDAVREALAATAKAAGVPLAVPPPRAPVVLANPAHTVHVVVTKDVPEEAQDRWLEMAEVLAHHTWREAGCIKYAFIKSADSPTRFVIVEEWESEAHLLAHFATEHFITLIEETPGWSATISDESAMLETGAKKQFDVIVLVRDFFFFLIY